MAISNDVINDITHALSAENTDASANISISNIDVIQSLWGGYGELFRAKISGSQYTSVIVKHIKLPQPECHPKGWNTALSHQRKLKSYQVEANWYQHYAKLCSHQSTVPQCIFIEQNELETLLILEDLHTLGFDQTLTQADDSAILSCLKWLGYFHGQFMEKLVDSIKDSTIKPPKVNITGLWPTGTYWHLATRPDELAALTDLRLKSAAEAIDRALQQTPYQTLVHGDAKLANFCFNAAHDKAAAVDFQYVGQGCGMKDVILLLSSTLKFDESPALIEHYLDYYFQELTKSLAAHNSDIDAADVEQTWRPLYCIAWADFQRFIKGWSPQHVKINAYTEMLTAQAIKQIEAS
ncbi:phosphotransferase [Shewanella donghaensis]|uniref:phosphotransferase n=1 Tax=Shewanella donghaensis TaxID=238836 RepID=UPI0011826717|nr:phosphotransferase [Shewanella donghaensis]